jgi:hypothetical protein
VCVCVCSVCVCVCDRIGRRGGGAQRAAYADVCSRMLTYALKEAVGEEGAALCVCVCVCVVSVCV